MSNETVQSESASEAGSSEPLEREFLHRLDQVFRRLRRAGIPFCILRNRDRIPRGLLGGSDVDIIVPAGTRVHELVRIVDDLRPAHIVPHRSTVEVYFLVGPLLLHVDFLIPDRAWRGAGYLRNAEILAAARDDQGMPVASPLHQAFCAWVSSRFSIGVPVGMDTWRLPLMRPPPLPTTMWGSGEPVWPLPSLMPLP